MTQWMMCAAIGVAVMGCGKGGAAKPKEIEAYAPVTNFKPSGGVAAIELAWPLVRGVAVDRYHVTVTAPDGSELWKTDVPHPPVLFSTEGIMATKAQWQVQAFEGTTLRAQSKKGDLDLVGHPVAPSP